MSINNFDYSEHQMRRLLVQIGQKMYHQRLVVGLEGNLSARLNDNEILTTPRGVCKGQMSEDDLIVTTLDGDVVRGSKSPSTEIAMHLVCYKNRPDCGAILHGHPAYSSAHALCRLPLDVCLMPEITATFGRIPVAPYATPSTKEVPDSVAELVKEFDAIFLANHGLLVIGSDPMATLYKMETVEHFARIHAISGGLGSVAPLDTNDYEKLMSIRNIYGLKEPVPACKTREHLSSEINQESDENRDLINKITAEVCRRLG